jgi:uncharacterized protein YhbP (UPF0306 family)
MKAEPRRGSAEQIWQVRTLLDGESTLVLSVTDAAGAVHSAPLFYVTGEGPDQPLDLLWLSSPESLHSKCLQANQRASVAVFRPTFEWRQIAGVQMRGLCSVVEGEERAAALNRYRARFHLGQLLGLAIRQSTLYRFHPQWVRLTDNQQHFGWKAEFLL